MTTFDIPTDATVSAANRAHFDSLKKGLGMVPNLYATLAHSDTALGTYLALQNAKSSLDGKAREVVNLVVSEVNRCAYCLAAHTVIGGKVGFTPQQIMEIRHGRARFDAALDALARLVHDIVTTRGHADPERVEAFLAAGWTRGQLVDVIVVIGDKTVTNYLHGTTRVPVDFPPAPPLAA